MQIYINRAEGTSNPLGIHINHRRWWFPKYYVRSIYGIGERFTYWLGEKWLVYERFPYERPWNTHVFGKISENSSKIRPPDIYVLEFRCEGLNKTWSVHTIANNEIKAKWKDWLRKMEKRRLGCLHKTLTSDGMKGTKRFLEHFRSSWVANQMKSMWCYAC